MNNILPIVETKINLESQIVDEIPCWDSHQTYIGQTNVESIKMQYENKNEYPQWCNMWEQRFTIRFRYY